MRKVSARMVIALHAAITLCSFGCCCISKSHCTVQPLLQLHWAVDLCRQLLFIVRCYVPKIFQCLYTSDDQYGDAVTAQVMLITAAAYWFSYLLPDMLQTF